MGSFLSCIEVFGGLSMRVVCVVLCLIADILQHIAVLAVLYDISSSTNLA